MSRTLLMASTTLFLAGCSTATATPSATGDPAHPTVVELYQSQGCSSCPPADAVVNRLADRPDVIALSFAVTYWDQLGWKDTFGDPAYTARQWDYARAAGRAQVATPQVIVNGRDAVLGSREGELNQAITRNANHGGPAIAAKDGQATIGQDRSAKGDATVWIVRYDPRTVNVAIGAGENSGRMLAHRNIVRQLVGVGQWHGAPASFALPAPRPGLRTAVLVQQGKGGPIIAAGRI